MPYHSYFIPTSAPPRAPNPVTQREKSDRLHMLSGCAWNFRYFQSIHELNEEFYLPGFHPDSTWKEEVVPFSMIAAGVSPDIPAELVGDEVRIKQILINVINNAIKYTSEGSVSLSVQCEMKEDKICNMIYMTTFPNLM